MVEHKLPGLAIGIVKDGEVVYQKGYGLKAEETTSRVTTNSMFAIASISKAFTVAAMGKLVDQGKVNWDDKVTKHLPDWKLSDPYVTEHFTVRDLLCHRAGLKTFDGDLLWYGTTHSRDEIVKRIRELPLTYEMRARFGYQNIMFITAGEVIEAASGMSWDRFVKQELFDKVGMRASNTSITQYRENADIALPHVKGQNEKGRLNELFNYDNSGATAAINSNVVDMTRWIRCWLNEGVMKGDTVMSMRTIENAWNLHTPLYAGKRDRENGTYFKGYGLGWFLMDYDGMKVVHHGGGLPGYISKIFMVPDEEFGAIILTNGESNLPSALMNKILDMYQGVDDKDWSKENREGYIKYFKSLDDARAKLEAERQADVPPTIPLDSLLGKYTDKMYGGAEITTTGKKKKKQFILTLLPTASIFNSPLEHWSGDTYKIKWKDDFLPWGLVTFVEHEGQLGFTIKLDNPDFHFFNLNFRKD